jgi:hypothetical protein
VYLRVPQNSRKNYCLPEVGDRIRIKNNWTKRHKVGLLIAIEGKQATIRLLDGTDKTCQHSACTYYPTRKNIKDRAANVRANWSPAERRKRKLWQHCPAEIPLVSAGEDDFVSDPINMFFKDDHTEDSFYDVVMDYGQSPKVFPDDV